MSRTATAALSAKAAEFLATAQKELHVDDLQSLPMVVDEPAVEAERVMIDDPAHLTPGEVAALAQGFHSRFGLVAFQCRRTQTADGHPLTHLGAQLHAVIPARWPVNNASDQPDGTTKLRNLGPGTETGGRQSRSLTNLAMAAHQDGWRSLPGVLAVTGLWADSAPAQRAATYAHNILRLALDLWRTDPAAFTSLFAQDAVRLISRSDGTVVTSPVLLVDNGRTRTFFREPNQEWDVLPGADDPAARRAIGFLAAHTGFGANGSVFTYLDRPGRGLLLNNHHCVHGRTAFTDGTTPRQQRIIASKWWACDDDYRQVIWG